MADSKLIEKASSLQITETSNNKMDQPSNDEDLQRFTHWGDDSVIEETPGNDGRRGWSVEEMFKTNQKLGVSSTFKDDLTQYTTCPPEGSKEDIERADRIAREIEQSDKSKRMAFLENDDEERDLDKETIIPKDGGRQNRNKRGKPFIPKTEPMVENHRANALRDFGPSQRGNRQQQDFGRQKDRNFNKPYQPTGQVNTGNTSEPGQQPLPSDLASQSPAQSPVNEQQPGLGQSNPKSQTMRRAEDLRSWGNNFSQVYRPTAPSNGTPGGPPNQSPPVQQQQQAGPQQYPYNVPPPQVVPQQAQKPSGPRPTNAWQKGPPTFTSQQQQQPPIASTGVQIIPQQGPPSQPQQSMPMQQQQQQQQQQPHHHQNLQIQQQHVQQFQSPPQQQQQQQQPPPHMQPQQVFQIQPQPIPHPQLSQQHQVHPQHIYVGQPFTQPPPLINPQLVPPQQSLPNTIVSSQQYPSKQPSPDASAASQSTSPNEPAPASTTTSTGESKSGTKKFQFDPNAPAFIPQSRTPSAPIATMHPQYITAQALPQSYASPAVANPIPQGYVIAQMPHNPNMIPQAFIPQPMQLIPNAVPIYNPQIVSSAQGYPFIPHQGQTIYVRPSYNEVPNSFALQQQHPSQYQYQIGQPLPGPVIAQQLQAQQPPQQIPPQQLPYNSQPPPTGMKKFGQN